MHAPLDQARLVADLAALALPVLALESAAGSREQYLMRPELGRRLASAASTALAAYAGNGYDVAFVVADGLSARAVAAHAQPLLAEILPRLRDEGWRMAPLTVVRHGRVAIGDAVAAALAADIAVVLIGERPGLSAPDSMGAYLTWRPTAATTDAERNCISNIRPAGLALWRCRLHARPSVACHARAPPLRRRPERRRRPACCSTGGERHAMDTERNCRPHRALHLPLKGGGRRGAITLQQL